MVVAEVVAEAAKTMVEEEAEAMVVAEAATMDEVTMAGVVGKDYFNAAPRPANENDECQSCHNYGHFARTFPNQERLHATIHDEPLPPPEQQQDNQP